MVQAPLSHPLALHLHPHPPLSHHHPLGEEVSQPLAQLLGEEQVGFFVLVWFFWSMNLFTKARTISQHLNIFFVLLWLVVLDMNFWHSCFLVIVYKLVQTSVQIEKVVRTQTLTTARGSSSATSVKPTVRSAPLPSSSVPIQWTVIYQRGWTVEPGLGDIETDLNNLCFQNFKRCERILYNKNIYSGP